jgi:hypothetical protein
LPNIKPRLLVLILIIAGCSSTRQVTFESEPPGAVVLVGGEEYITPCVVDLTDEKTTVEMLLGPGEVMLVDVPEGYGFWERTAEAAGTTGAYALYGIAYPFSTVGEVGETLLGGWNFSCGSKEEALASLILIGGTITGKVVGDLIAVTGESLEASSDLKEHSILVVFPVASPTSEPTSADGESESPPASPAMATRRTPAPLSPPVEKSLLY